MLMSPIIPGFFIFFSSEDSGWISHCTVLPETLGFLR